jgi:ADP-heptose:LPS heptosyltransferase
VSRGVEPPFGPVSGTGRGAGNGGDGDVLVLRALGLGDAFAGVAALRGVRRAFPTRRLVLAAPEGVGAWLRDHAIVDDVLPTSGLDQPLTYAGTGHVAVNLHGRGPQSHRLLTATHPVDLVAFGCSQAGHAGPEWKPDEHEVDRWCRLVQSAGGDCSPEDLRIPVPAAVAAASAGSPALRMRVADRVADSPSAPVVVHPGAASNARRWPEGRWTAVARALAATGHSVIVTGSGDEVSLCERIAAAAGCDVRSVAGTLNLDCLAKTVASAPLLMCGDTGVAHLATAFSTPSVLLFGPTPPAWWGPAIDAHLHTVLWHGTGPGDPHADTVDPALAAIDVAEVLQAAHQLLAAGPTQENRRQPARCR